MPLSQQDSDCKMLGGAPCDAANRLQLHEQSFLIEGCLSISDSKIRHADPAGGLTDSETGVTGLNVTVTTTLFKHPDS